MSKETDPDGAEESFSEFNGDLDTEEDSFEKNTLEKEAAAELVHVTWDTQGVKSVKMGEPFCAVMKTRLPKNEKRSAQVQVILTKEEAQALRSFDGGETRVREDGSEELVFLYHGNEFVLRPDVTEDGQEIERLCFTLTPETREQEYTFAFQGKNGVTMPFTLDVDAQDIEIYYENTEEKAEAVVETDSVSVTAVSDVWNLDVQSFSETENEAAEQIGFAIAAVPAMAEETGVLYTEKQALKLCLPIPDGNSLPKGEYTYDQASGAVMAGERAILYIEGLKGAEQVKAEFLEDNTLVVEAVRENDLQTETASELAPLDVKLILTEELRKECSALTDGSGLTLRACLKSDTAAAGETASAEAEGTLAVERAADNGSEETSPDKEIPNKQILEKENLSSKGTPDSIIVENGSITVTNRKSAAVQKDIYWIDNHNSSGGRPDSEKMQESFSGLSYTGTYSYIKNGEKVTETITLTAEEIGITQGKEKLVDLGGTGHWQYELSADILPAKGTFQDKDGEEYEVTFEKWTPAAPEAFKDGYQLTDVTEENSEDYPGAQGLGWYYVEKTDFSVNVESYRGDKVMENVDSKILEQYYLYAKDGNQAEPSCAQLGEIAEGEGIWNWESDSTSNPGKGKFTLKGIPKYNLDGSEILYWVDQKTPNDAGGDRIDSVISNSGEELLPSDDYLKETIENSAVSNHGTNTTEVYNGGTLKLTRTGYTTYTARKDWHDDADPSKRPKVEFQLWRFTKKPGMTDEELQKAYQTASPVKDKNGKTATFAIEEKNQEGDSITIDFTEFFESPEGVQDGYLPKYDSEGNEYVYLTREYLTSTSDSNRYEVYYGALQEDGTFQDTLPGNAEKRDDTDNSIYNTGVVSNVLTENIETTAKKTWHAAAFQSELADVTVVLRLQTRTHRQGEDDQGWENTEETQTLTGFVAENLTQEIGRSMPKYNKKGEQLEYRWVEEAVYQGTNTNENLLQNDSFTLRQKDQEVRYTSEVENKKSGDGSWYTGITNKLENKTEYRVTKTWDPELEPKEVILKMYRSNYKQEQEKLVALDENQEPAKYWLTGTASQEKTPLYVRQEDGTYKPIGFMQETKPWYAEFTELEKYDETGHAYDYILLEQEEGGYTAEYSMEMDEDGVWHMTITNVPGPGDGRDKIYVRKQWVDDSDVQHRGTVTFTVYEHQEDGSFQVLEREGFEPQIVLDGTRNWWTSVQLPSGVKKEDILILETEAGEQALQYEPEQMEKIWSFQKQQEDADLDGVYINYETSYHHYETTYHIKTLEGLKFYTVRNRRLGNIDITVKKNWKDGSLEEAKKLREELKKKVEEKGYSLALKLVCKSVNNAIDYENGTIKLIPESGRSTLPILDADGRTVGAIQSLSLEDNQEYFFFNLPKYDKDGAVVQYAVEEVAWNQQTGETKPLSELGLQDNEYSFSISQTGYVVGKDDSGHKNDAQEFTAVNRLTGTKEIKYHKEWKDAYQYNLGTRPDIYLDLYQLKHTGNGDTELTALYLDRKWTFYEESAAGEGKNYMTCNFGSLPKYDDLGYEIIYYAREKVNVDKTLFDYSEVYYKYPVQRAGKEARELEDYQFIGSEKGYSQAGEDAENVKQAEELGCLRQADGTDDYLLKEGGMFLNKIEKSVTISGKKLWANLPSGYLAEDLPAVKFTLYQYAESEAEKIPEDQEEADAAKEVASLTIENWAEHFANGEYSFKIQYQGENINVKGEDGELAAQPKEEGAKQLPKYDDKGNLYTYILRETFINEDLVNSKKVFDQPIINNYAFTNGYHSPKGKIRIKKWVDISSAKEEEQQYPAVSFEVTRRYMRGETEIEDERFSRTVTIHAKEFKTGSGQGEAVVENLEVYAPNGSKYRYYVKENYNGIIEGGYTFSWKEGDGKKDDTDYRPIAENELAGPIELLPSEPEEEQEKEEMQGSLTFRNCYHPQKSASLVWYKYWDDSDNALQLRPDTLTFEIKRYASAQPGENDNPIGSGSNLKDYAEIQIDCMNTGETQQIGDFQVKVEEVTKGSAAMLKITLKPVEVYAPNGNLWTYVVEEQEVDNPYYIYENNNYHKLTWNQDYTCAENQQEFQNRLAMGIKFLKRWMDPAGKDLEGMRNPYDYTIKLTLPVYVNASEDKTQWKKLEESPQILEEIRKFSPQVKTKLEIQWAKDKKWDYWAASQSLFELPTAIKLGGKETALKYAILEGTIELLDEKNQSIYGEELIPHFEELPYIGSDAQKNETRTAVWYEFSEKGQKIRLFRPQFDSEKSLEDYVQAQGEGYQSGPYLNTDRANENLNYAAFEVWNVLEMVEVKAEKEWEDGSHEYNRPINGTQWNLDLVVQRAVKDAGPPEWETIKNISITGDAGENKGSYSETFPRYGLEKEEDGTYEPVEYQYRVREKDREKVIEENTAEETPNDKYNGAYKVHYEDQETEKETKEYCTSIRNVLDTTEVYANKIWKDRVSAGMVTLELKYLKEDGSLCSFSSPAKVVLDGEEDSEEGRTCYYEYAPWKAVWEGVPKTVSGSKLDENGRTIYRVVETQADFSYPADDSSAGNPDISEKADGTEEKPFELQNEAAKLKVEKTMASEESNLEEAFSFRLTGGNDEDSYSYQIFDRVTGEPVSKDPEALPKLQGKEKTFTLKAGQYVILYGLRKGVEYTVTEILQEDSEYVLDQIKGSEDFDKIQVDQEKASASGILPAEKPKNIPVFTFVNQSRKNGKITIEKTDHEDQPLAEVQFQLMYRTEGEYRPVDASVCSNETLVENQGIISTNSKGLAVFDGLAVGKEEDSAVFYRIKEIVTKPGMNLLAEPIDIQLPFITDKEPAGSAEIKPYKTKNKDGKTYYYYAEVKICVKNNETFVMPVTGGDNTFYLSGLLGLGLAAAGSQYWLGTKRRRKKKHP